MRTFALKYVHPSSRQVRGNSYARRRRRQWLISQYGIPTKAGVMYWVKCHICQRRMTAKGHAWEVDRHPKCGHNGGRYVRGNIRIACAKCNRGRCNRCMR